MNILYCLDRYLSTEMGDVKFLQSPWEGLRLRCGDYRLFFSYLSPDRIQVTKVAHRSEAYR